MNNQNNLNINSNFYNGIISDYSQIISILNQCSSFVNGNMLSGELRTYYDQSRTSNEISSGIDNLVTECENTKIKINEGVETCNAVDEEMKWQLESLMNSLFTDETISSDEYMGRTYEERVAYVNNLLASSKSVLEEYEKMYEETFGKGIKASEDSAVCFVNLLTALGLFDGSNIYKEDNLFNVVNPGTLYYRETGCFDINKLGTVLDYCNNNGVIPAIREYIVDGKSWGESGLEKLFGKNLKACAEYYWFDYSSDWENYDAESIFIQNYVNQYMIVEDYRIQNDFYSDILTVAREIRTNGEDYNGIDVNSDINNIYNIGYDNNNFFSWGFDIKNKDYAIELIKGHIRQNDIFAMYDESQELHTECVIMQNDINVLKNDVYNMEQYAKLLPFEPYLSEEGYLRDYAKRDYSNYKNKDFSTKELKYLSQDEVAMLAYIYDKYGIEQADDYYDALEDRRCQREGFEGMAEFAESLNKEHGFNFIEYLMENSNTVGFGGALTSGATFEIVSNLFPGFYDWMVDAGIATTEGFIDGNYNFIDGLSDFIYADGIRDAKDYEMIYKMKLLMGESIPMQYGNEVYEVGLSEDFSDFQKTSYKYLYQYGNTIGNMTIPTLVSYVPYVGKALSFTLRTVSSIGNNTEDLMQQGLDKNNAYMYGTFLGLSEAVIEQIVGGLPGSAGNVPKTWLGQVRSMLSESAEEVIQTYTSAVITSYATGEPIDLAQLNGEALEAALMAIATTGTMNAGGMVTIKMLDDITINTRPSDFNSYAEWKASLESEFREKHPLAATILIGKSDDNQTISVDKKDKDINLNTVEFTETTVDLNTETSVEELSNVQEDKSNDIPNKVDDDINNGVYMGGTEYSPYSVDRMLYPATKDIFNKLFALAPNDEAKSKLEKILYSGGVDGFGFTTGLSNRDNPNVEVQRRIAMANLYLTHPDTFNALVDNNVNLFHGTSGNVLTSILNDGLNSGATLQEKGIDVITGEEWSRGGGQRDFVSFTELLDLANGYAGMYRKGEGELSFPVIIGTTAADVKSTGAITVSGSDLCEVGVRSGLPNDKIRVILVPFDKVELVKEMVGNNNIEVLPINEDNKNFYSFDQSGFAYVYDKQYDVLREDLNQSSVEKYTGDNLGHEEIIIEQDKTSEPALVQESYDGYRVITDDFDPAKLNLPYDEKTFSIDDVILVRSTENFPNDHTVLNFYSRIKNNSMDSRLYDWRHDPIGAAASKRNDTLGYRQTIHFSTNGLVAPVPGNDWTGNPFIILEPLKHHIYDEKVMGFGGDLYYDHNMKLSDDAVIMVRKDYYDANKDSIPDGYNIVLFEGNTQNCLNSLLYEMGYMPQIQRDNPTIYSTNFGYMSNADRNEEILKKTLNDNADKFQSCWHSTSEARVFESNYTEKADIYASLYNEPVDMNQTIVLTEKDFMYLRQNCNRDTKYNDSDSMRNFMLDYGYKYDVKTNQFYSVDYQEYILRREAARNGNLDNYEFEMASNIVTNIVKMEQIAREEQERYKQEQERYNNMTSEEKIEYLTKQIINNISTKNTNIFHSYENASKYLDLTTSSSKNSLFVCNYMVSSNVVDVILKEGSGIIKGTKSHVDIFGEVHTEFVFDDDVQPEQLKIFYEKLSSYDFN